MELAVNPADPFVNGILFRGWRMSVAVKYRTSRRLNRFAEKAKAGIKSLRDSTALGRELRSNGKKRPKRCVAVDKNMA